MDSEFRAFLMSPRGGSCADVKDLGNGFYAAIKPLLFHWTLIIGLIGDTSGYDDRWCYADQESAAKGLQNYDGTKEPEGWHRHPASGRRRKDGNPATEYISF